MWLILFSKAVDISGKLSSWLASTSVTQSTTSQYLLHIDSITRFFKYFTNSHFINFPLCQYWPNGNWQSGSWQSGKLMKWELTKWELTKWELTKWKDTFPEQDWDKNYKGVSPITIFCLFIKQASRKTNPAGSENVITVSNPHSINLTLCNRPPTHILPLYTYKRLYQFFVPDSVAHTIFQGSWHKWQTFIVTGQYICHTVNHIPISTSYRQHYTIF